MQEKNYKVNAPMNGFGKNMANQLKMVKVRDAMISPKIWIRL